MKKFIKEYKLYLMGAVVGAVVGFLYWKFVGCSSGTCMITSNPRNSSIYFAFIGSLLFGLLKKEKQKTE